MDQQATRREVTCSLEEATALIEDGMTVAIGGFGADNHPMAMVREIIRRGVKGLTVVGAATAGLDVDMMIGAGSVRKVIAPYVGLELYCPIGHNFRKAGEAGEIEVWECSEYLLYAALFAAASGQDFMAWRGGVGSSIPDLNKDLKVFRDPIHGERDYVAVPAVRPDWAIIHVNAADCYGNGQHYGAPFGDRWIARAADRIMLVTERIVPNELIRRNPMMTSISYADCVVEAPYGSHPFAAHGAYTHDEEHIVNYVEASVANRKGDADTWKEYLDTWVYALEDHIAYLEKVGIRRLLSLYTPPIVAF